MCCSYYLLRVINNNPHTLSNGYKTAANVASCRCLDISKDTFCLFIAQYTSRVWFWREKKNFKLSRGQTFMENVYTDLRNVRSLQRYVFVYRVNLNCTSMTIVHSYVCTSIHFVILYTCVARKQSFTIIKTSFFSPFGTFGLTKRTRYVSHYI